MNRISYDGGKLKLEGFQNVKDHLFYSMPVSGKRSVIITPETSLNGGSCIGVGEDRTVEDKDFCNLIKDMGLVDAGFIYVNETGSYIGTAN